MYKDQYIKQLANRQIRIKIERTGDLSTPDAFGKRKCIYHAFAYDTSYSPVYNAPVNSKKIADTGDVPDKLKRLFGAGGEPKLLFRETYVLEKGAHTIAKQRNFTQSQELDKGVANTLRQAIFRDLRQEIGHSGVIELKDGRRIDEFGMAISEGPMS